MTPLHRRDDQFILFTRVMGKLNAKHKLLPKASGHKLNTNPAFPIMYCSISVDFKATPSQRDMCYDALKCIGGSAEAFCRKQNYHLYYFTFPSNSASKALIVLTFPLFNLKTCFKRREFQTLNSLVM